MNELGIAVMACQRPHYLLHCLSSIIFQHKQDIHLWLDRSIPQNLQYNNGCYVLTKELFPHINIHRNNKHLGIAQTMPMVLSFMSREYKNIICVEEDVFLTSFAIKELYNSIQNMSPNTFSMFGDCAPSGTHFRSIAWGTTSNNISNILPLLTQLCEQPEFLRQYLMDNKDNISPQHQIADITKHKIHWGGMVGYINSLDNKIHKRTPRVCAYHVGMDKLALHYHEVQKGRKKNPIRHMDISNVWDKFLVGEQT